jgi:hypothetical protein
MAVGMRYNGQLGWDEMSVGMRSVGMLYNGSWHAIQWAVGMG